MTLLCDLGVMYGVDKAPAIFHSYTPEYHRILSGIRGTTRLVVEIGIGYPELMAPIVGKSYRPGASLRMWRDYFPNTHIVGCDIKDELFFEDERISCEYVDQSDMISLMKLKWALSQKCDSADLIVDDGSHEPEHMIGTMNILWPFVRTGGYYIIEDIKEKDLPFFERLHRHLKFSDCDLIYSHKGKNSWDSFVCFRKKYYGL